MLAGEACCNLAQVLLLSSVTGSAAVTPLAETTLLNDALLCVLPVWATLLRHHVIVTAIGDSLGIAMGYLSENDR